MDHSYRLAELIGLSMEKLPQEPIALAFSGGLDSSLLAHLLKERQDVSFYTVGMKGCRDLETAGTSLDAIGIAKDRWMAIEFEISDVKRVLKDVLGAIGSTHPMLASISVPFYLLCEKVEQQIIVCGQGADEQFGGYQRYVKMGPAEAMKAMHDDTLLLLEEKNKREEHIGKLFSKAVIKPYLAPEIIDLSKIMAYEEKITYGARKLILRNTAKLMGLPETVADLDKKAMQFSTGTTKAVEQIAKDAGLSQAEYLRSLI